jgi:hypothetical protein
VVAAITASPNFMRRITISSPAVQISIDSAPS